jgi:hypothetical protein
MHLKCKFPSHTQVAGSAVLGRLVVSLLVSMAGGAARFIDFLSFWSTSSGRNWTMTAVMLSHPVPSPRVLGARQWSNSCKVTSFLYFEMPNQGAYFFFTLVQLN